MKLYTLGCCSGTEPMPGLHHTSFALEINDKIYIIDAGEGCAHTAHTMGLDVLKITQIFISHPHMDHVGGLANLLWTMRKISKHYKRPCASSEIGLHISELETWEGVYKILKNSEGGFSWDNTIEAHQLHEGLIYSDDNITVTALHNNHIAKREEECGKQLSFSFKVESEGKTIIFSGDVKTPHDLDAFTADGCDYLLMETGHHKIKDVCEYVNTHDIKNLMFVHHGREVLASLTQAQLNAQQQCNKNVFVCKDRDVFEI